jgi:hypothetical protein
LDYEEVKKTLKGPSVLVMAPFKSNYELDEEESLNEQIDNLIKLKKKVSKH